MIFDTPNITWAYELMEVADTYTGGLLGIVIWVIILFGSLFLTSNFNMKESMVASSFILMTISFFLKYLNLLADYFLWISAMIFIVALVVSFTKTESV